MSLFAEARITVPHRSSNESKAVHHKRPRFSGSTSSRSTSPPHTSGVTGVANDVAALNASGFFKDSIDSEQQPTASTDTGLQVSVLSPRSASATDDTDDDKDILPLKHMREDTLKLFPPEELESRFNPFWFSDFDEELYRDDYTDFFAPIAIDECSWFLLRNHVPFHFVSSPIVLWHSSFYNLLYRAKCS